MEAATAIGWSFSYDKAMSDRVEQNQRLKWYNLLKVYRWKSLESFAISKTSDAEYCSHQYCKLREEDIFLLILENLFAILWKYWQGWLVRSCITKINEFISIDDNKSKSLILIVIEVIFIWNIYYSYLLFSIYLT